MTRTGGFRVRGRFAPVLRQAVAKLLRTE